MLRRSFEPEHDLGGILGNLSELELEHAAGRFHDPARDFLVKPISERFLRSIYIYTKTPAF
jgi:hypothetical protein